MRLLLTAEMKEAHAGRLAEFKSAVEPVELVSGVDPASLDLAFFSSDCYPDRMVEFMGVVLKAENIRWLHSFSAGVDHPIFATLKDKGMKVTTSSGAAARPIAEAVSAAPACSVQATPEKHPASVRTRMGTPRRTRSGRLDHSRTGLWADRACCS